MDKGFKKIKKRTLFTIIGVTLIAIILIPMLYSSIYLSAFWDTYGNLNSVPVAFVNLDKPISKDGEEYNIGKDVENNLKDNDKVKWNFVSYDDAKKGVEGYNYYAIIIIPEDFSQKLANSTDGNFEKPEVVYEGNKGKNYVFSQISQRVADGIKANIAEEIQKNTSKKLVDKLSEVKDKIRDARDGTGKINNGTQQLLDGSVTLTDGTLQAKNGSDKLQNGLKDAANGESQILNGTVSLIDGLNAFKENLTQKNNDVDRLVGGAKAVAQGTSLIKDKINKANLSKGMNDAANGIDGISKTVDYADSLITSALRDFKVNGSFCQEDIKNLMKAQGYLEAIKKQNISEKIGEPLKNASTSAQDLVNGLDQLQAGAQGVASGTEQLAKGIENTQAKAAAGADQLIAGANQLKNGNNSLLNGLNTAVVKAGELKNGLANLNSGAANLSYGLNTVNNGVTELNNGLKDGYTKINDNLKFTSDDMANFVSEPVVLRDQSINDVKYYGEGLAPYFISLSLWLGAMFTNLGLTLLKKINKIQGKVLDSFIGKFLIGAVIAVSQASLLSLVLVKGLNIDTVNVSYFYMFNMFIAVVFFSIMYGASNLMGIIATPIMFIIFLLQLSSAGGTFPIETAPKFFRIVGEYFPMTYSINGLRMIISGINASILTRDINILVVFMSAFLVFSSLIKNIIDYVNTVKNEPLELEIDV